MAKIKNYKEEEDQPKKRRSKRSFWSSLIFLSSVIVLMAIAFTAYSLAFQHKAYFGLKFAGESLGGRDQKAIETLTKVRSDQFLGQKITLETPIKKYQLGLTEVTLSYDSAKTAERAVNYAHKNDLIGFRNRLTLLFKPRKLTPAYQYNENALTDKIKSYAVELDQPEKDYSLQITSGKVEITTERAAGRRLNQGKLLSDLRRHIEELDTMPIQLAIEDKSPSVSLTNAQTAKTEAEAILAGKELTLVYNTSTFMIDIDTLGNWILATPNGEDLVVDINRDKVRDYLKTVVLSIDIGPQDAMLSVVNGKVTITQPSQNGVTVDQEATLSQIVASLLGRISQASTPTRIAIVTKVSAPSITNDTLTSLGLTDLIGSGTTSFATSPANRISNITLGARLINGALVKPGETFSTLKRLGKVDASSGFLPELVIKENKTVPEYGGGLCQVSTTLFRAALNSGLKILERQNHSYRVSYYEPPVGMDATIYDPAPDFKFQNDTAGYILVQSKIVGKKITFEMYGTKDGRVVTMSDPVISEVTPPPEPIMQPTDTLPAGEQKQVDHAHDGAIASFTYVVTKDGQELYKNTFISHYVPWPARFLVGTGPVAPAPTPADTTTPPPADTATPAPST